MIRISSRSSSTVVGLYLNPPEHAIVLSVDEKSQIQALDRTQPGLPIKKGGCGTMTHEYKRNGTTTLFAAVDTLESSYRAVFHGTGIRNSYGSSTRSTEKPSPTLRFI